MKLIFFIGWLLLIGSFLAAALEGASSIYGIGYGPFVSARELLYTTMPADYVIFRNKIESISPFFWDPVLTTLLLPPAWALFLAPGIWIVWKFRPNQILRHDQMEEVKRQNESLFLVDELSDAARNDETFSPYEDDCLPNHFIVERVYNDQQLAELDKIEGQLALTTEEFESLDSFYNKFTNNPKVNMEETIKSVYGPLPSPGQVFVDHEDADELPMREASPEEYSIDEKKKFPPN